MLVDLDQVLCRKDLDWVVVAVLDLPDGLRGDALLLEVGRETVVFRE